MRLPIPALTLALSLALGQLHAQGLSIFLRDQSIQYPANFQSERGLEGQLASIPSHAGRRYAWLQLERSLSGEELLAMARENIRLLGYVREHSYWASFPQDLAAGSLRGLPVRGIFPIQPEHRLSTELRGRVAAPGNSAEKISVQIAWCGDLDWPVVARLLEEAGFPASTFRAEEGQARWTGTAGRLRELAKLTFLHYIEVQPGPGEPEDRNGQAIHRSTLLQRAGTLQGDPLDGSGVAVLVRDDGRIGPHIDYAGRLFQDSCFGAELPGNHGDMVAGILAGDNNLDPYVQGMAPAATIFTMDYNADFMGPTMGLINDRGVVITNSSYSDGCNTGNTMRTQRVDAQIFDNPHLMHVFSAGNAGTNDCGYGAGPFWGNITGGHKAGKNSIATANLASNYVLEQSSSRGPVWDGRLKPDISAHGANQLSTYPNHTISNGGGTSAAAPGIAGVMAQLYQLYRSMHNGQNPESALIKGALLVTATDQGVPGPDFSHGWGHVNAYAAGELLRQGRYERVELAPGEIKEWQIQVPDGLSEGRIMVYWADPPAIPQAARALVNDLELRVIDAASNQTLLPLVLDHTPDPFKLAQPAVPGEDHLNNMEQVRIASPTAGSYTVRLEGSDLPFGNGVAFVYYEWRRDSVHLAYPLGGERVEPATTLPIYWESEKTGSSWSIDLSLDSGATWLPLAQDLSPALRSTQVTLPDTFSHKAYIRLTRDGVFHSHTAPIQIFRRPTGIKVTKACPDSIHIQWTAVPESEHYDIHILGAKRMAVAGTSDTSTFAIPTWNPLADNWFAVSARGPEGVTSERSRSVRHSLGLVGCKQTLDIKPDKVISPPTLAVNACEPAALDLVLSIRNDGLQAVSAPAVWYQIGEESPVQGAVSGSINPGGFKFFKFAQPPFFAKSGTYPLKVWTDLPNDGFRYNDTLYLSVSANIQNQFVLPPIFEENLEGEIDPPAFWTVEDVDDDDLSWQFYRIPFQASDSTKAAIMPNYFYDQVGSRDLLVSPPIDLSQSLNPRLSFDLAYSGFQGTAPDSLLVEISTDCGATVDKTIFAQSGEDLITVADPASFVESFVPSEADWRTEVIDLHEWVGQKVQLRIVNVAGYGNNLWIDNIRVGEAETNPLAASFEVSADSGCTNTPILVSDESAGNPTGWTWDFGTDATPGSSQGQGPHSVSWSTPGWKQIKLRITLGPFADSVSRMVFVGERPNAAFTWKLENDSLKLEGQSIPDGSFRWYLDGQAFSSEQSPGIPLPSGSGPWTVLLVVNNACGADSMLASVSTVATQDHAGPVRWTLSPNPTSHGITLRGSNPAPGRLWLEVVDLVGSVRWQQDLMTEAGSIGISLPLEGLPQGHYILRISLDGRYQGLPFQKL